MDNDQNEELSGKKPIKRARVPLAVKVVAKVLTETGMSQREAARELDVSLDTVQRAIKDPHMDRDIIETAKLQLPIKMYNVAYKIAERLNDNPDIINKMNPYMCSLVLAIMIDKARLMQGQSTENIEVKQKILEVQAGLKSIAEIRELLRSTAAKVS